MKTGLIILLTSVIAITLWVYNLLQELPDDRAIRDFTPHAVTMVYDRDGDILAYLYEDKNQIWVSLTHISETIEKAIIATEDPYFLKHGGIDYRQTWESIKDNLQSWQWVRGGSTITQQVAKNVYLSREKTLARKIKEYFLAKRIESLLPKDRILEIYLNEVGWGYGIYGIELASRFYLDKHADEVNIAEAAFLTAMLRNPAYYNPYKMMDRVTKRQRLVLLLMLRHHLITQEEYDTAISDIIKMRRDKPHKRFRHIGLHRHYDVNNNLPCYVRLIEGYLVKTIGPHLLYDVGREVRTTLDDKVQDTVEDVIKEVERKNNEASEGDIKIGLLLEDADKVRAIGCTMRWEDTVERIKRLGPPFDSYAYEVVAEKDIAWKDILLIAADERLL